MRVALVLYIVLTSGYLVTPERNAPSRAMPSIFETGAGPCFDDTQLSNALRDLASGNQSRVDRARVELVKKSKMSPTCRSAVITALIKAMDKPNLDFNTDTPSYYLWLYGAELLGDLKAAEALDLLVSHLNLHHAVFGGPSLSNHPAMLGVIKMGPIAIPKLGEALKHNGDPKMRYSAIYCIANIGGQSAISALKEDLASESDECAKRLIRVSLDSLDEQGVMKNSAEWFGRFTCNQ
jgi:hypothetical protein